MHIPGPVRELLWEYDLEDPSVLARVERVMVERVMERGGWAAMQWLLRTFDRDRLRRYLEERGSRVLPPRELRFWSWACGVAEGRAREWVREARDRERAWRG